MKTHILSIVLLWRNTQRIFQHKKCSMEAILGARSEIEGQVLHSFRSCHNKSVIFVFFDTFL